MPHPIACAGLNPTTVYGTLAIDETEMNCPAWDVLNVHDLWAGPPTRGEDRIVPGTSGRRSYRRRADAVTYSLEVVITGQVDPDGDPYADPVVGLLTNIDLLRSNVTDPTGVGDGTRPAVLTLPDLTTRNADVTVEGMELGRLVRSERLATIDLTIPSGAFA